MMLAVHGHYGPPETTAADAPTETVPSLEGDRLAIRHGEHLFGPGDPRRVAYRVLSGALCHYMIWPDGSHDVIEFAFPGDVIGLGHLGEHISTAQAMVDTSVAILDDAQVNAALDSDAELSARMASAADREFEFVRRRSLGGGRRTPLNRVAAYILAVCDLKSHAGETHVGETQAHEAGDLVAEFEDGPALANLLEIAAPDLAAAVTELAARKLIARRDDGLAVLDRRGLEALAA